MKTKLSVGDKVYWYAWNGDRTVDEVLSHEEDGFVKLKCFGRFSIKALAGRIVKKPRKCEELEISLNLSKEINRKLANHNADLRENNVSLKIILRKIAEYIPNGGCDPEEAIRCILKEHAEMKKVLSGRVYWIGHRSADLEYDAWSEFSSFQTNRSALTRNFHTKVLVLETKASGEV